MHTLYLCYFWLNEPLVQTQVLPYLRELQKDGIKVSLMTFEREMGENWTPAQIEEQRRKFAAEDIDWYPLPYHKSPSVPATVYDVFNGARLARRIIREKNIDVLHARVHVPAMMGAIARKFSRRKPKLIFDIRGFFPEEYTDAGRWKENGWIYKAVKRAEKWLLKDSDAFVVLTEKAREILFPESRETGFDRFGRAVEVIPCCVNLEKFAVVNQSLRREMREKLRVHGRRVITYVGSFGGWYMTDEMIDFFAAARESDKSVFALILTKVEAEMVAARLEAKGFTAQDYLVTSVTPAEIPAYMSAADIALSFIRECYSKQASSPTKIAEYLASGLPVISNRGIGDLDEMIETDAVGVLVEDFNAGCYRKSLQQVGEMEKDDRLAQTCRASAKHRFDLEKVGGEKYRSLYRKLFQQE